MFHTINSPLQSATPVSNAVRVGHQVFTSQIPRDPLTSAILVDCDIAQQARRVFENLRIAMEAAGGCLHDIYQMTIFLVDPADAAGMNKIYLELFRAPYPSRATVVVKELALPGMRIEITAQGLLKNSSEFND